jgi:3-hydroxyisobutyrate dehydrogenase-like beta-hydroxyacid dehydrogenase
MSTSVAVIAPGGMGAAVGARLTQRGARVVTSLAGRSAASGERAKAAGMTPVSDAEIAAADFVLSIVPPREALPLAERLKPALIAANEKPIYVECNAVSPETAKRIAAVIAEAGCPFVDAGIIGSPPREGYNGPNFYVSGPEARRTLVLNDYGLFFKLMNGPVGAASAIKMCYGGITKGLTAMGSAMALAAHRAGVADDLHAELMSSQPQVMGRLTGSVPDMFSKAYRWVAEMEEVASFLGERAEGEMFDGIAELYQRLADDMDGSKQEIAALDAFFAKGRPARRG